MKVAIIYYSTYGHVAQLAKEVQKGVQAAGGEADIFQLAETLNDEVLTLIHAPPKPVDVPVATLDVLSGYDAFLFGIPTRYGTFPSQFSSFWDSTGALWAQGALHGKPFSLFISTGTIGGGQEITVKNSLSSFVHHGMIYVPLGYKDTFADFANTEEVRGGSPWGAGTFAGGDGSRQPSETELKIAKTQGEAFYKSASKLNAISNVVDSEVKKSDVEESTTAAAAASKDTTATTKEGARKTQASTTATKEKDSSKCCIVM